jgi:Concanavalin A-like lectin/glucanases superfamily
MKTIRALTLALYIPTLASATTLSNYQYTVTTQGPTAYFKLDGSLASSVDPSVLLTASGIGGYAVDGYGNYGDCYFLTDQHDFLFNNTTLLISGGGTTNTTSTASGSISFLFKTLDAGPITGQRFLFSAGNTTSNGNAFALFVENNNASNGDPNSIKLRFGNNTTTILPAASIAPDAWYYCAVTYSESRVPNKALWYIGKAGGALATGMTTNSAEAVAGAGVSLFVGNNELGASAFRSPGTGEIDEFAIWNRELNSAEVNAQFAQLPQAGTPAPVSSYEAVITNQAPDFYYKLDGSLQNSAGVGGAPILNASGGGFTFDYFGGPTNSAYFSATSDALSVNANLLNGGGSYTGTPGTGKGSVSLLFRTLSNTNNSGQRFIFSAGGAVGVTNAFGLFLENWTSTGGGFGSIKYRYGADSKVILQVTNIVLSDWYYFAGTYDESQSTNQAYWYLGRPGHTLQSGKFTTDVGALAGQGNIFIIGNYTNSTARWGSPGTGQIEQVGIWHRLLGTNEITAQFNALVTLPPSLSLTLDGSNVVLSWPSATSPSYLLEATPALPAAAWTNAGSPTLVGDRLAVTNVVGARAQFYRLHQQ